MASDPIKRARIWPLRLATAAVACAAALLLPGPGGIGGMGTAAAQWGWGWGGQERGGYDRRPSRRPAPQQPQSFGFPFFGGGWSGGGGGWQDNWHEPRRPAPQPQQDFSRAPPPKKPEVEPPKTVLVLGDAMADWLAYGLEDAFSEAGAFGVIRKHRTNSSLIRNEPREYDWVQGARDALAERADVVVMMIGLGDRHAIRERAPARPQQPAKPNDPVAPAAKQGDIADRPNDPGAAKPTEGEAPEQRAAPAAETAAPPERTGPAVSHEFRSEKWVELYGKRIDDVIAVLKAKRVPVLWVGLPPIRGTRARAELSFLNEIYRSRAAKAGIVYVDVWEGFVDESGEFTNMGPDVMGQVRRLRSGDGVFFTKFGARKLAHFVDREINRLMSRDAPMALPIPDEQKQLVPTPGGPAARPSAGPVVSLTGGTPKPEPLLGGRQDAGAADALAAKVLVNGEPIEPAAGRADNFIWPAQAAANPDDVVEPPPEPVVTRPGRALTAPPPRTPAAPRPGQRRDGVAEGSRQPAGQTPARAVR